MRFLKWTSILIGRLSEPGLETGGKPFAEMEEKVVGCSFPGFEQIDVHF
jgi:hypothetical protein